MEKILVLDFGGQYNQLIARRVRDHHVYAEILPYTTDIEIIKQNNYKGIILQAVQIPYMIWHPLIIQKIYLISACLF